MSTKNSIIFAFMVIFLAAMLVTLGMWFHYALELDIKNKALSSIEERAKEQQLILDKMAKVLRDPEMGLEEKLKRETQRADSIYARVHTDPEARKTLFEEKKPAIADAWKAGKAKWDKVYKDWRAQNAKLKTVEQSLKTLQKQTQETTEQGQSEMLNELKREEKERRDYLVQRKKMEDELELVRMETEEIRERINKVSRDLEKTPEEEPDGVVIHSSPDLKKVIVDVGYQHGVRPGMEFKVFSGRHNVPMQKAEIRLTKVRAVTSEALVMPFGRVVKWDPNTGWEATDPNMRYSLFHADKGTGAVALEKKKSLRDLVEDLRIERIREEQGAEAAEEAARLSETPTEPPPSVEEGDEYLARGDWISNTEFVRVVTEREFRKDVAKELLGLRDVNLGSLTFYISDAVRPYRKEFLKRLCMRNRCRVTDVMSPDVDYIVSTRTTMVADLVEKSLKRFEGQDDVPAEVAGKRTTLAALKQGLKYGSNVLSEDQVEAFFVRRERKSELTKGKAIQPGQHTFYVVGNTRTRSIRETRLLLKELGGHLAPKLDTNVDYVVVGAGLHDAFVELSSGRVYPKDQAPTGALPFYEAVRKAGWKVLREDELLHFFGRE